MLWFRTPEKIYFKKGCMPVALDELGTIMHKKKAFIVTDTFLYQNGYVKPIEEKLDQMGIQHTCFYEVAPDPTLQCAQKGVEQMKAFQPDTIIALGGGSAMDAGKIMWVMYEHPAWRKTYQDKRLLMSAYTRQCGGIQGRQRRGRSAAGGDSPGNAGSSGSRCSCQRAGSSYDHQER